MHAIVMPDHRPPMPISVIAGKPKPSHAWRLRLAACGIALAVACPALEAGVLQHVEARYTPPAGSPVTDTDSVFAESSTGINRDILAHTGVSREYEISAAAGRFGQVGMELFAGSGMTGSMYRAEILVGSDEYVNTFGSPARVRTQFIIDGGQLLDLFSTQTSVTFELKVGAENRGIAPAETSQSFMDSASRFAADFGAVGLYPGGGYTATLASDASGNLTYTNSFSGGMDLHATFDGDRTVEIPLSLQTLELGTLLPGERLLVGYQASLTIERNGVVEGIFADFSDPFTLDGEPNPVFALAGVTITPVPEPGIALLCLVGLAVVAARKRFAAASPATGAA
jgi:hypothetical protein